MKINALRAGISLHSAKGVNASALTNSTFPSSQKTQQFFAFVGSSKGCFTNYNLLQEKRNCTELKGIHVQNARNKLSLPLTGDTILLVVVKQHATHSNRSRSQGT
jgi:hypothetical protein